MYCPVDGTEWRAGITRCPEHDVDLVEELPEEFEDLYDEEEVTLLERWGLEGAAGYAAVVAAVAAAVYAIGGVLAWGFFTLAELQEWRDFVFFEIFRFVHEGARAVALGALGCLVAGILGRTWLRLSTPLEAPAPPAGDREAEDDERWLSGPAGWVASLLSSLVIVFTVVWAVTGLAISWDEVELTTQVASPFSVDEPSDSFVTLSVVNTAAYTCALSALVVLGALVLARVYDRLARRR